MALIATHTFGSEQVMLIGYIKRQRKFINCLYKHETQLSVLVFWFHLFEKESSFKMTPFHSIFVFLSSIALICKYLKSPPKTTYVFSYIVSKNILFHSYQMELKHRDKSQSLMVCNRIIFMIIL